MPRYKYENAHDWLAEKARTWTEAELYSELMSLALKLDDDTIQDMYQREMAANGYFEDLDATKDETESY